MPYYDDRRSDEEKAQGNLVLGLIAGVICFPFGLIAALVLGGPKTRAGAVIGTIGAVMLIVCGAGLSLALSVAS